ncbi:MAG: TspO/MBR family protein [bacterium]|nr:TspO/MBR family protein [bacterium]
MKIKLNYIIIPLIAVAVAVSGSLATSANIASWYSSLTLPSFAPPGQIIGIVWTALYVLITASVLLFWNKSKRDDKFQTITGIFLVNAFLNAFWSYVFFSLQQIGLAIFVSSAMALTIYALIYFIYSRQRIAALLLIPYGLWVTFATYLNYLIWTLN